MAQIQGVLYCLPHKEIFRVKIADRVIDIPWEKRELTRGSFSVALEEALNAGCKLAEPITVDFILPHNMYGVDFITLPGLKKNQLESAFEAKLRSLHKNYDDLVFRKQPISTGKTVTFRVMFARRTILDECKEGFARLNININSFVPEGLALCEGVARLDTSVRKGASVVLSIDEQESYMAAFTGDTMIGGLHIPFGMRALSDNRVMYERLLYHSESAELLVINAKERAKATKLTMAIDLGEDLDELPADENEIIEKNPDLPDLTIVGDEAAEAEAAAAEAAVAAEAEAAEGAEEEVAPAIKTLRKNPIRVLPKFMRREEPTTPEGYVLENFRLFERRILLMLREMSLSDFYPRVDNVFLVLPPEFEFVVAAMNAENPDLHWKGIFVDSEALIPASFNHVAGGKAAVF